MPRMRWCLVIAGLLVACENERAVLSPAVEVPSARAFALSSAGFANGATIPDEYTADGSDVSPPLAWSDVPEGTRSLVLIMEDPDAPVGTWDHWLVYDLPGSLRSLGKGEASALPEGAVDGTNSWGRTGYGGPAPPPGKPHRYYFELFALREPLGLAVGAKKPALEAAMDGKVLGEASWMGTYGR
jgi:Raf kinase inhibitor-like YbhB/YbcL family protein